MKVYSVALTGLSSCAVSLSARKRLTTFMTKMLRSLLMGAAKGWPSADVWIHWRLAPASIYLAIARTKLFQDGQKKKTRTGYSFYCWIRFRLYGFRPGSWACFYPTHWPIKRKLDFFLEMASSARQRFNFSSKISVASNLCDEWNGNYIGLLNPESVVRNMFIIIDDSCLKLVFLEERNSECPASRRF